MSRSWLMSVVLILAMTAPAFAADDARVSPAKAPGLVLPGLYIAFAGLNTYDGASTRRALKLGAVEANPLMGGIVNHPAAMWAVKGGVTVAAIAAAENLRRQGHGKQAIALMLVTNGLMTAVAVHNASVVRQMR